VTSAGGGSSSSRPRLSIDHVQVAVADLEQAAQRMLDEHGLVALPGGRHPFATANMIIPFGADYLELIAVVAPDEALTRPTALRVANALQEGRRFPAWAVRTDDLDQERSYLLGRGWELPDVAPGARTRPDGAHLEWRLQELVPDARPSALPFLIEWRVPYGMHPAATAVEHPSRARRIKSLTLSDPDPAAMRRHLQELFDRDVEYSLVRGDPGIKEVVVGTDRGDMVLR